MEFNDICKSAYSYFVKHMNIEGLCSAVDIGDCFVFSAGDPNVVNYGGCMVSVDKQSGIIEEFGVTENLQLLMQSKKMNIPNEYKFRAS